MRRSLSLDYPAGLLLHALFPIHYDACPERVPGDV